MKALYIKRQTDSPEIRFDKDSKTFLIQGKSLPENAVKFYQPVIDWLDEYIKHPNEETVFTFKMEYLNTASSKIISDIVVKFRQLVDKGKIIIVNWYYETNDYDMKKLGADISFIAGVRFDYFEFDE